MVGAARGLAVGGLRYVHWTRWLWGIRPFVGRCSLEDACDAHVRVCVCVSVTRSSLLGNGLTRTRQGVSSQDEQGLFSGKPKCLARGSLRPTVKKLGSKMLLGRPDSGGAEGPGGRPPCPGQARLPGWWGQEASGAAAQGPGQCCMV